MDLTTLDSGCSESLPRRFPPGRPTPPHSVRSPSNPAQNFAPYQVPLPFPDFNNTTFDKLWDTPPVYVSDEAIVDIRGEDEFLGPRWRVITRELGTSVFNQIRCGTRIVFRGVDPSDVSYFVIGYCLVRGSVSYVDVFVYKRGSPKPISNSVLWPPFTLCVAGRAIHHSMKLNSRSEDWVKNINSRATDLEVERRLVTADAGMSSFSYIRSFWGDLFGSLSSCLCIH